MRMYGCITLICTIGARGIGKTGLCAVMITIAMSRMGLRIRPVRVCVCVTLGRPGPGREAAEQESIDAFQITGADTI